MIVNFRVLNDPRSIASSETFPYVDSADEAIIFEFLEFDLLDDLDILLLPRETASLRPARVIILFRGIELFVVKTLLFPYRAMDDISPGFKGINWLSGSSLSSS